MSQNGDIEKPFCVEISMPESAGRKRMLLPAALTFQPGVQPEMLSGFVNRLIFDPEFKDEFTKDPVPHLNKLGIKISPEVNEDLAKINIKAQFDEMRPDVPEAVAAAWMAIVVILVFCNISFKSYNMPYL